MYIKDNRAVFSWKGFILSLSHSGDCGWRLQSGLGFGSTFDDMGAGQVLARDLGETPCIVRNPFEMTGNRVRFTLTAADGTSVRVCPDRMAFYASNGAEKIVITDVDVSRKDGSGSVTGLLSEDERVYGTGERFNSVNQRGQRIEMLSIDAWCCWKGNTYCPIPLLISSKCAALFMNRYERSTIDIGAADKNVWSITEKDGAPIDLYIFLGDTPQKLLQAYCRISGFSPKPAPWLYGTQICRYYPDFSTPEGVMDMAEKMRENDFPWDAVILEGWPTYDTTRYDELKALCDQLHAMGKQILMYEACGRTPKKKGDESGVINDSIGTKAEYLISNEKTGETDLLEANSYNPADNPFAKKARFVDITNPEAWAWWTGDVWGNLVHNLGINGAKIDFCEEIPDHLPLKFADGRKPAGAHHWYPTLYNALMYKLFCSRPEGGMCFSRGGGIGAQRYPFLWAGDQLREFFFLKNMLVSVLSSGMSGIPFMSYDMAAYRPARDLELDPEHEVFIRGLEYTAFSANIQTHGLVKRPYDFDDHTKDVYRAYAKLHDALRPYLVEQGNLACETGMPLMRHLFLYDPADANVLDIEDEYMLGDALLVAPVLDASDERDIYLPQGTWQNIFTGEEFEGGQTLNAVHLPLEAVAVFRLKGCKSAAIDEALRAAAPFIADINALCAK